MADLINALLGKLLLAAALGCAVAAAMMNAPEKARFDEDQVDDHQKVMVELDPKKLATENPEIYFAVKDAAFYRGRANRAVFVEEVRKKEFQPVELGIPNAGMARPPMLLPSMGPSLEGAKDLPRWGEELPPVMMETKKKASSSP